MIADNLKPVVFNGVSMTFNSELDKIITKD